MTGSFKFRRWLCAVAVPVLGMSAAPLIASADVVGNVGGGVISGSVRYSSGGVPTTPLVNCVTGTWHLESTAAAVVVALVHDEYAGQVTITADGGSCAAMWAEGGNLTSTIAGTNTSTGGTLQCGTLSGIYERVGTEVNVVLNGACSINGAPSTSVRVAVVGPFVPDQPQNNLVKGGQFNGTFALEPL
jgi:hypothetical protein